MTIPIVCGPTMALRMRTTRANNAKGSRQNQLLCCKEPANAAGEGLAVDINLSPELALSPDSSGRLFNGTCVSFVEDRVDICDMVDRWRKF